MSQDGSVPQLENRSEGSTGVAPRNKWILLDYIMQTTSEKSLKVQSQNLSKITDHYVFKKMKKTNKKNNDCRKTF